MKKYWKSVEEFQGIAAGDERNNEEMHKNEFLELFENDFLRKTCSRRDFLKVFGFSLSSAAIDRQLQKTCSECHSICYSTTGNYSG